MKYLVHVFVMENIYGIEITYAMIFPFSFARRWLIHHPHCMRIISVRIEDSNCKLKKKKQTKSICFIFRLNILIDGYFIIFNEYEK